MRILYLFMPAVLLAACGEPLDPREQFLLEDAQKRWNISGANWQEPELRQLEYGRSLYNSFCAACHLTSGEGQVMMGAPALRENSFVRGPAENVARKVLFSKGSSMPPFHRSLDNEQVAAILGYVRNAWGHRALQLVAPATVAQARQAGMLP